MKLSPISSSLTRTKLTGEKADVVVYCGLYSCRHGVGTPFSPGRQPGSERPDGMVGIIPRGISFESDDLARNRIGWLNARCFLPKSYT